MSVAHYNRSPWRVRNTGTPFQIARQNDVVAGIAVLDNRVGDREGARRELKAALESTQPFAERLDALRLLRETSSDRAERDR